MPCRGICTKYKAARGEHGGHYGNGHKRCNECELFLAWPGAKCPCCLLGSELVYAIDGAKPIADVQEGELVLDKDGKYTRVMNKISHGYMGYIYGVRVSGHRKIMMTDEHPVFVLPSKKVDSRRPMLIHLHQAKDLHVSDELIFPLMTASQGKTHWKLERRYKKFYSTNQYQRIRDLNDNFVSYHASRITHLQYVPITADLCRLWGYYLAEGSCKDREVYFYFDKDETSYIQDLQQVLRKIGFEQTNVVQDKRSRTMKLAVSSAALARALVKDFGKLAEGKHLPPWIYPLPPEFAIELIRGWVRGDGTKYRINGIMQGYFVVTVSRTLAYDFRLLLANLGYLVPIHAVTKTVGNRLPNYRLFLSKRFGYMMFGDKDCECPQIKQRYSVYDRFISTPIVSIERELYDGKVYNLTTESETYMTTAFAVHNCKQVLRTKPHNTRLKARMRES